MNHDMHVNTLHIYERLKKSKSFEAQARELADILGGLVDDKLATKNDVFMLDNDLKQTEARLENELRQTETRLQSELRQTELRLQAETQAVVSKSKSETIRWIIGWTTGLIFAQTGMLMTFIKISL